MAELQLYGKTLPVALMEGVFEGVRETLGNSGARAICSVASREAFPNSSDSTRLSIPLYNYCILDEPPQDLDYRYVSLLIDALRISYGRKGSLGLEKRVAQNWCLGPKSYNLQSRYGEGLENFLIECIDRKLVQKHQKQKLAILALRYLFERFKHESGIDCHMQFKPNRLIFKVDLCPFCLHKTPDCQIFASLIGSFIEWIEGSHFRDFPSFLEINEKKVYNHEVVVTILKQAV